MVKCNTSSYRIPTKKSVKNVCLEYFLLPLQQKYPSHSKRQIESVMKIYAESGAV